MASSPMRLLARFGHKPHPIDTAKYGQPRVAVYWAARDRFTKPGVHVWAFSKHWRVFPLRRKRHHG